MHFVMEELFMLRKLALVKEIRTFDNEMAQTLQSLNALRNAMAHSFLPEMKRDYRRTRKVTWKGKDLYTSEGVEQFDADMLRLHDYLFQLAFGKKLSDFASKLRGRRNKIGSNRHIQPEPQRLTVERQGNRAEGPTVRN